MSIINTPKSQEGNLIRFSVFIIGYLLVLGSQRLILKSANINIFSILIFIFLAWIIIFFFAYRYRGEDEYFDNSYKVGMLEHFKLIAGLMILILVFQIVIAYFQAFQKIPKFSFQTLYLTVESKKAYYFLLLSEGIVFPILQEFIATGFLFNYFFTENNTKAAILGIATSGFLFSLLNFELSVPLFLANWLLGSIFAWSFLRTQNVVYPIYFSIFAAILTVIMT